MTTMISTPPAAIARSTAAPAVVPYIPDSAPFTPAQRAYLNGFLAGMVGGQIASANNGMNSGVIASSGSALVAEAPAVVEEETFPWHDPAIAIDERLKLAEEKPQERKLMAAMAQLDCGACGYICQTYGEAIARGEEKDLTRCTPGGKETSKTPQANCRFRPKKCGERWRRESEKGCRICGSKRRRRNLGS